MNLKQKLVGAGLVGLLATSTIAIPSLSASVENYSGPKQKLEHNLKQEHRFYLEGKYSIPFNVSREEAVLYGTDEESIVNVFSSAMDSSRTNQWTRAIIPIDETKYPGSGADMYLRVYPSKNIFTQLTIGYEPYESKQSLDENVDEFIKKAPLTGNSYITGSKSKIKFGKTDAIEFKLKGLTGKTMIFTINKDKIYKMVYGSYDIKGRADAIDPENSLEKFEKGFRFSE
jgi:hypothetical protein